MEFRLINVVRAAPKLQVIHGRFAAVRIWDHMMKLQEAALLAPARQSDKGALRAIPIPHCAPHMRWHVPCA